MGLSGSMERGESILDAIFDGVNLEDAQDVEMMEVEEGELVGQDSQTELGQNIGGDVHPVNQETSNNNRRRRNKKKKSKKKKGSSGPNVTDINRFVSDVCKHLNEKKMYLMYTAVGCLGVSALSDLVKEVDAIQACGGQKTADGRHFRNGGGILWSVLKTRDRNAFEETMKKGKEFEVMIFVVYDLTNSQHTMSGNTYMKQFKPQNIRQGPVQNKEISPERMSHTSTDRTMRASDGSWLVPHVQNQLQQSNVEGKHVSVYDRMRVPVSYDDLLGEEDPKDKSI
ncbi:unnamed protein product [Camellia sinensis]